MRTRIYRSFVAFWLSGAFTALGCNALSNWRCAAVGVAFGALMIALRGGALRKTIPRSHVFR